MSVDTYPHVIFDLSESRSFFLIAQKYKVNAECMNPIISFEDSQNLTPFEQTIHTLVLDFYHTEGIDPRSNDEIQKSIVEKAITLFSRSIHTQ